MNMHVRAVEQGIALGDHGDHAARIEPHRDGSGRFIVERGERLAIGGGGVGDLRGDGIMQRELLDAGLEMRGGNGARIARVSRLGEMGDDFGRLQRGDGVQREQAGIARADTHADETAGHSPSLASALTAAAVIALPPIRPRTMR